MTVDDRRVAPAPQLATALAALSTALLLGDCGSGGTGGGSTGPAVSVAVTPTTAVAQTGLGTQAFVAAVANATNTIVTWQVNGRTGGDATIGTISAAGLYTAPAEVPLACHSHRHGGIRRRPGTLRRGRG